MRVVPVWQYVRTFHIEGQLSGESHRPGDDHLTHVPSRVRRFCVVNVQWQVGVGHYFGKTDSTCKLGTAVTQLLADIWDDL